MASNSGAGCISKVKTVVRAELLAGEFLIRTSKSACDVTVSRLPKPDDTHNHNNTKHDNDTYILPNVSAKSKDEYYVNQDPVHISKDLILQRKKQHSGGVQITVPDYSMVYLTCYAGVVTFKGIYNTIEASMTAGTTTSLLLLLKTNNVSMYLR